ncbi:MAG TPA: CRTAC1 family protein [Bryobacteraceae bacterium]|nr:CRTAC1 family protein [Bryobacteraceae bacterium]
MIARRLLQCLPIALFAANPSGPIAFEEISQPAGIAFTSDSSPTPQKHQPEALVGGVAIFDFDGDGYADIYFVNGADMPSLEKTGPRFKNRLFRNNHNLTFTDVTDKAGVAGNGYGMGVAVGDFDNDGKPDLYVTNINGNQLFHNNGDGTFTDIAAKAHVAGGMFNGKKMWSIGAAWVDYNNDGLLDLFVANYCQWDPDHEQPCSINGNRVFCNPRFYKPLPNTLYRNNGDGTFTDVSVETGIAAHPGRGMGVAVADFDGDGFMDIAVANDDLPNQLFHNVGGKKFEEVADEAGVALTEGGNVISGMGIEFRDLFNRGLPDLWITAIEEQTFPLFKNLGRGQFAEATAMAGLGLSTAQMSGWSNAMVDLDNDGWKDLYVARANVIDNVALFTQRQYEEPNTVFRSLGNGKFQDVTSTTGPEFQKPAVNRGAAFGDLDNDGRMDLVVSVLNSKAKVFHNTTKNDNHWVLLKLIGTKSNRMGLGAQIKVTAANGSIQYNHATTSTGYASSSDPRVHFGLGASKTAKEIQIAWPSGRKQVLLDVAVDRVIEITEPPR